MTKLVIPKVEEKVIEDFSEQVYREFGDNVISIILFGSKSRGDYKKNSDTDILVVFKNLNEYQTNYIYGLVINLVSKYKVYLSVKIFSEKEFEYYKSIPTMFINNVLKDGIKI